jgi:lipopolysaccharide transport system permease protein
MIQVAKNLYNYRELIVTLAWSKIAQRYKQAFLGIGWAIFRPVLLMLMFTLVRSFVGIETGDMPYPLLTFAALLPWTLFQDATTEGVNSVVANTALVRKIYFPREVFPVTAIATKLVEFSINVLILIGLMWFYKVDVGISIAYAPFIILYVMIFALALSLFGSAINVTYRDIGVALPVAISFLMYASPVIYPLSLVEKKLLVEQAAGDWSNFLYTLYTLNPLAGIIDAFQASVLQNTSPDFDTLLPGIIFTLILLPLSYVFFRRAEGRFADVI